MRPNGRQQASTSPATTGSALTTRQLNQRVTQRRSRMLALAVANSQSIGSTEQLDSGRDSLRRRVMGVFDRFRVTELWEEMC